MENKKTLTHDSMNTIILFNMILILFGEGKVKNKKQGKTNRVRTWK
jgi:hypothetical protein